MNLETRSCMILQRLRKICKLHGYTVHRQYPAVHCPTNAYNVKKRRVIRTF